ncbi:MAG: nucleoside triphosphate pyrophosphohydrolase [Deltaproteobacteria bacterium]|nr:nucleoside triphosphate pyrophosphohydrolase [Deltaproteobacteria bacterium]
MNRHRLSHALTDLYDLVARLRGPGGCPWDARQTSASVRMYVLEEAYEVLDASEKDLPQEVCQELGDLLFQIIFLAYMGEERGDFDLVDVMERIHEKMVRRHPHVFGSAKVESAEEVSRNWARIKEREKEGNGEGVSPLDSIPPGLPALLRAHRLGERAAGVTRNAACGEDVWDRTRRAFAALEGSIAEEDAEQVGKRIGRVLFDLATLARRWGWNAEELLRSANREFAENVSIPPPLPSLGDGRGSKGGETER